MTAVFTPSIQGQIAPKGVSHTSVYIGIDHGIAVLDDAHSEKDGSILLPVSEEGYDQIIDMLKEAKRVMFPK